jgi:1,4-dihydroxy-2-naphthoate octaprenyltransferase
MLLSQCRRSDDDGQSEHGTVARRLGRRGTTMMEYLMMISLIVVFCLIAISFLGTSNNGDMSSSANAINKAMKKGN